MDASDSPKLRNVEKIPPPYPLNSFPKDLALKIGEQVIYILATKPTPVLEGAEWEQIFAEAIGADWKPSNIGLDDIILKNCAWGAKTIKSSRPWTQSSVRLISGRNSPSFSYGKTIDTKHEPNSVGTDILEIWNKRVEGIRSRFAHARTVVLIKSDDLLNLTIFESDLIRYDKNQATWKWNKNNNLEGFINNHHIFTWQPHGSQFTIIEKVPEKKLKLKLKPPEKIDKHEFMQKIGFNHSWIEIID